MKKIYTFCFIVCSFFLAFNAEARLFSPYDKAYVSLKYVNAMASPIDTVVTDLEYSGNASSWGYFPSFSIAGGYSFGYNPIRLEVEVSGFSLFNETQNINFDDTALAPDLNSFNAMNFILGTFVNLYFDHPINNTLSIYTGGGLGSAFPFMYVHSETSDLNISRFTMPKYQWNLTIGASLELDRNLFFDAGYRYVNLPNGLPTATVSLDSYSEAQIDVTKAQNSFHMSQITFGMRYMF